MEERITLRTPRPWLNLAIYSEEDVSGRKGHHQLSGIKLPGSWCRPGLLLPAQRRESLPKFRRLGTRIGTAQTIVQSCELGITDRSILDEIHFAMTARANQRPALYQGWARVGNDQRSGEPE